MESRLEIFRNNITKIIKKNDTARLRNILDAHKEDKGFDINGRGLADDETLLMYAAKEKKEDIAQCLLEEYKAEPDSAGEADGHTCLYVLMKEHEKYKYSDDERTGITRFILLLLKFGANPLQELDEHRLSHDQYESLPRLINNLRLCNRDPNVKIGLEIAKQFQDLGDFDQAVTWYEKCIAKGDKLAHQQCLNMFMGRSKNIKALAWLKQYHHLFDQNYFFNDIYTIIQRDFKLLLPALRIIREYLTHTKTHQKLLAAIQSFQSEFETSHEAKSLRLPPLLQLCINLIEVTKLAPEASRARELLKLIQNQHDEAILLVDAFQLEVSLTPQSSAEYPEYKQGIRALYFSDEKKGETLAKAREIFEKTDSKYPYKPFFKLRHAACLAPTSPEAAFKKYQEFNGYNIFYFAEITEQLILMFQSAKEPFKKQISYYLFNLILDTRYLELFESFPRNKKFILDNQKKIVTYYQDDLLNHWNHDRHELVSVANSKIKTVCDAVADLVHGILMLSKLTKLEIPLEIILQVFKHKPFIAAKEKPFENAKLIAAMNPPVNSAAVRIILEALDSLYFEDEKFIVFAESWCRKYPDLRKEAEQFAARDAQLQHIRGILWCTNPSQLPIILQAYDSYCRTINQNDQQLMAAQSSIAIAVRKSLHEMVEKSDPEFAVIRQQVSSAVQSLIFELRSKKEDHERSQIEAHRQFCDKLLIQGKTSEAARMLYLPAIVLHAEQLRVNYKNLWFPPRKHGCLIAVAFVILILEQPEGEVLKRNGLVKFDFDKAEQLKRSYQLLTQESDARGDYSFVYLASFLLEICKKFKTNPNTILNPYIYIQQQILNPNGKERPLVYSGVSRGIKEFLDFKSDKEFDEWIAKNNVGLVTAPPLKIYTAFPEEKKLEAQAPAEQKRPQPLTPLKAAPPSCALLPPPRKVIGYSALASVACERKENPQELPHEMMISAESEGETTVVISVKVGDKTYSMQGKGNATLKLPKDFITTLLQSGNGHFPSQDAEPGAPPLPTLKPKQNRRNSL